MQHALHGWVAFGIMPLFALANAGVPSGKRASTGGGPRVLGVAVGLVLGKPIGVMALSWLAVRVRLAALPAGVGWSAILVVASWLASASPWRCSSRRSLSPPGAIEIAKLGILVRRSPPGSSA